jgi:hypothetical protein
VVDDRTADAPQHLDIKRAWFDYDGSNLISTIEVARLDENAIASSVRFLSSWRYEHVGYGLEARRDAAGAWTFSYGLHRGREGAWVRNSERVTGELTYGAPGYIRMAFSSTATPVGGQTAEGHPAGGVIRDTGATSWDNLGVADRAPDGATEAGYGRGAPYRIETCPSELVSTLLSFTENSASSGQFTDEAPIELLLEEESGAPIADAEIDLTFSGASFSAATDGSGIAYLEVPLEMEPGVYELHASWPGDETRAGASVSTPFTIEREDTALELEVSGNGNSKMVRARLTDLDSGSGIAGRTVEFFTEDGSIGSAETDEQGIATLAPPTRHRNRNSRFSAAFYGDNFFWPSEG